MLQRAAAAVAKIPADRIDALRTRLCKADESAAVQLPWPRLDLDNFARQRIRHVEWTAGPEGAPKNEAIPVTAHMVDAEALHQMSFVSVAAKVAAKKNSRLPSAPSIAEGKLTA